MGSKVRALTELQFDTGSQLVSSASLHLIDDWGVLLDPLKQRIYRLNRTSAFLWCCFAEGWSRQRVEKLLSDQHGLSRQQSAAYVDSALAEWRDAGLIGDGIVHAPTDAVDNETSV
ncbi:MAG: PqqD family protein, partial [Pseudomonadota bacterium]